MDNINIQKALIKVLEKSIQEQERKFSKLNKSQAQILEERQTGMFGTNKTQSLFNDFGSQNQIINKSLNQLNESKRTLLKELQKLDFLIDTQNMQTIF